MAYSPRKLILLGLGALALSTSFVFATSNGESPESKEAKAKAAKVEGALKTLQAQLQRRFHDRNNFDFGMRRVVRAGDRSHKGPLSSLRITAAEGDTKKGPNGEWLIRDQEGDFVSYEKYANMMHAENDQERDAIQTLNDSQMDVAIYTVGFVNDKRVLETIGGTSWDASTGARAKGPAFISGKDIVAPVAQDLVSYARSVKDAQKEAKPGALKDGWRTYAMKVDADDESCVNCHNGMISSNKPVEGDAAFKMGQTLGIIIVAMRDAKPMSRVR